MQLQSIFLIIMSCLSLPVLAAEEISSSFVYDQDHRANFSNIRRGPLRVATFTDARNVENPNLIAEGYLADRPLADIVQDALVQGFLKGNATLVESGENLRLEGNLVSSVVEAVSTNGQESVQLTIRTEVKLLGSGRTMYQTVLFGRGTASVSEGGIAEALKAALVRSIHGLMQDDYFLNELL